MKGQGCDRQPAAGVKWLHRAAMQGVTSAQFSLGVCYETGCGVEASGSSAREWYTRVRSHPSVRAAALP